MKRIRSKLKKSFFEQPVNEKLEKKKEWDNDFTDFEIAVIESTSPFTMTSPERIISLTRATEYIIKNNIQGSIVECGVWKGGSIMAVLEVLKKFQTEKEIYLYDTFEGMTEPQDIDLSYKGKSAKEIYDKSNNQWCYSSIEEVKNNLSKIEYNNKKLHFVKGKVEDTIPDTLPENISILRLDTDWYESTKHEMKYLFPKLVKGGILIIDDYGHWSGCKKAIDEYLEENNIKMFLNRVDYTCRLGVKP